jgi:hypothetical protein
MLNVIAHMVVLWLQKTTCDYENNKIKIFVSLVIAT